MGFGMKLRLYFLSVSVLPWVFSEFHAARDGRSPGGGGVHGAAQRGGAETPDWV